MAPRRFGEDGLHAPMSGGLLALLGFKGEGWYLSSLGSPPYISSSLLWPSPRGGRTPAGLPG